MQELSKGYLTRLTIMIAFVHFVIISVFIKVRTAKKVYVLEVK